MPSSLETARARLRAEVSVAEAQGRPVRQSVIIDIACDHAREDGTTIDDWYRACEGFALPPLVRDESVYFWRIAARDRVEDEPLGLTHEEYMEAEEREQAQLDLKETQGR